VPDGFEATLSAALRGGDVAALRVAEDEGLAGVRRVAHAHGVAVILEGAAAAARLAGCDGAHLDAGDDVAAARRALGDLQLGVFCGGSRDQAMQAGQDGADYVSFGPCFGAAAVADPELVSWWVELMELPAVAEGGITVANCAALVQAGVDFLAVDEGVWRHEAGPEAAVRDFNEAIRIHAPDL
jgi:thiamine-phosphate pyrophosphorylase